MKKKAETYTVELLSVMTQGLERLSSNYTASGVEAVVNFQSEAEQEPRRYYVQIEPMDEVERRQDTENNQKDYDWGPEGPPPGIANASKLNMKKKALEIGGESFPDALKFKEETVSPLDVATDVQELYRDAESFVINYTWSGLRENGIIGPDDANVIQEDADKVRFSDTSALVNQFIEEGWFKYLEQSDNMKLKSDPELQQQIYDSIQTAIKEEGAV